MAFDEKLLDEAEDLVLRLYQWQPYAVSLGYFQRPDASLLAELKQAGLPCVRRMTGGGAILHADELTYSLAGPETHAPFDGDVENSYRFVHDAILEALRDYADSFDTNADFPVDMNADFPVDMNADFPVDMNADFPVDMNADFPVGYARAAPRALRHSEQPFLCFARSTALDLVAKGRKLVGSAKRRRRGRALQHGSILLSPHPRQPEAITLAELWPKAPSAQDLGRRLATTIGAKLNRVPRFENGNSAEHPRP